MMNQSPTTLAPPTVFLDSQKSNGGTQLSSPGAAEPPTYCLYFLVCLATTGNLAGLFKLGVTNHLPTRHHHHTRNWEEFDLKHSALLRAHEKWEVEVLERMLKKRFKKWRRYPGHDYAGHTEFFSVDCLAEMFTFVRKQVELGIGAYLSLEIDPAECARDLSADGMLALARKEQGALVAQENALKSQKRAEQGDQITVELKWVLGFAQDLKDYLVWVNLERWYNMPILRAPEIREDKILIDLYFGRFHPDDLYCAAGAGQRPVTQTSFGSYFGSIQSSAVFAHSPSKSRYRPQPMFYVRKPLVDPGDQLPHPVCADTILLRVECGRCLPPYSLLAGFEALAEQVGSLPRSKQTELCW